MGVNIQASREVKEMTPYLAEKEYEQGCSDILETSDYIVLNFTNGQSIKHLLEPAKLRNFFGNLKENRSYDIGVSALL